jgi:hypothetical protein
LLMIPIHMRQTRKESYFLGTFLPGLAAIATWCECWNVRLKADKFQAIYFSYTFRPTEIHPKFIGRYIAFFNH